MTTADDLIVGAEALHEAKVDGPIMVEVAGEEINLRELSIKELIRIGVEHRDELKEANRKHKEFDAKQKALLAKISMALKAKGDELGVDSFNTPEGTAYRHLKDSYRVGNWASILEYIRTNETWQMLEKRVAKLATKEIHEATGQIPPGVEYHVEEEFVIRRPNEKGSADE